jgi:rubrerythrin
MTTSIYTGISSKNKRVYLTNESVDERLIGRNIKRIGQIVNAITKCEWECIICGHTWNTTPNSILTGNKTGCSMCNSHPKWTNERIDQLLGGRDLRRIDSVKGALTKINWECLVCGMIWMSAPNNVITNTTGCPDCNSVKSKPELKWLTTLGIPDTPANRQVIGLIPTNKRLKVDGYIPETNTIYEFWGDYWHGNPVMFNSTDLNERAITTFGELYRKTQEKRRAILDAGYNLVEIWESDWNNSRKISTKC